MTTLTGMPYDVFDVIIVKTCSLWKRSKDLCNIPSAFFVGRHCTDHGHEKVLLEPYALNNFYVICVGLIKL